MRQAARWQAAIDIITDVDRSDLPVEQVARRYFRSRRYAGAKDRRAVIALVFDLYRRYGRYTDRLGTAFSPRLMLLTHLMEQQGLSLDDVMGCLEGERHGPAPLSRQERSFLAQPSDVGTLPQWAQLNYPEWLHEMLAAQFGPNLQREMVALNERAPTGIRVNTLKSDRMRVAAQLAAMDVSTQIGTLSDTALICNDNPPLLHSELYRNGAIEIQDEGSQWAADQVAVRPGMCVVDYCAGGGGKSLAMAAAMANRGSIYACDRDKSRLSPLPARMRRAGAENIKICGTPAQLPNDLAGRVDRLLLDVPCSGSGAWRRQPDNRWRLTPGKLADLNQTQAAILADAAHLTRPGGQLVYVTCSIFRRENEDIIQAFLETTADYRPVSMAAGPALRLEYGVQTTPYSHGCDGFYVAILERRRH